MGGQRVKGLVVGLGAMGLNHLRVLDSTPGVQVAGVVDPDAGRLAEAAGSGAWPSYAGLEAALDEARPDFVCLATPFDQLFALARRALEAGVAVLVEKPMAPDEESALELIDLARARTLLLGVGYVERCNPGVQRVKDELDAGRIGRVYELHSRRLGPPDARAVAMGVALDLATHDLDVMRYLAGAEVRRVATEAVRQDASLVEEALVGVVRFDNDVVGVVEASRLAAERVRELEVVGEQGTLVLDYLAQKLAVHAPGTDPVGLPVTRREPLRIQWDRFVGALRNGTSPAVDGFDGLAALSTARALQRSAARGTTVVPEYRSLDAPRRAAL